MRQTTEEFSRTPLVCKYFEKLTGINASWVKMANGAYLETSELNFLLINISKLETALPSKSW